MASESVAYQAANGKWTVWQAPQEISPVLEFAVVYGGGEVSGGHENKTWCTYQLADLGLQTDATYTVRDLVTGLELQRSGAELINQGLAVGLNKEVNRHHFVFYQSG